jgi:hypothetical protein
MPPKRVTRSNPISNLIPEEDPQEQETLAPEEPEMPGSRTFTLPTRPGTSGSNRTRPQSLAAGQAHNQEYEFVQVNPEDFTERSEPETTTTQATAQETQRHIRRLEIEKQLDEQRRILAQLQEEIRNTPRPEEPRGEKRARSDTSAIVYDRPPPKPAIDTKYQGKGMREFTTFMARMENHFRRHAAYYRTDEHKVTEAVAQLADTPLLKWAQHEKDLTRIATWEDFYEFHLHQINDPVNLLRQAYQKYENARQMSHQSVRDFVTYLSQWENQLKEPYTNYQRKEHLRAKLLPIIRDEAAKYPKEPEDYDAFAGHLQTVEDMLPVRRAELRKARENQRTKGKTRDTSQTDAKDSSQSNNDGSRKRSQRLPYDPDKKCNYCNKVGHSESECFTKKRQEPAKAADESKNS